MRKKERRTSEEKQAFVENALGKKAVQWCENRGVIIASAFSRFQPGSGIMSLYKTFMGIADAVDALMAYDSVYMILFFHFNHQIIVNTSLFYWQDLKDRA